MNSPSNGIAEHVSSFAFAPTVHRLKDAIAKAGMTVFASIDHAAGAREVGMEMPPTIVLLYGNARGGTPIMLATPQAALDLPLRVLVREAAERTRDRVLPPHRADAARGGRSRCIGESARAGAGRPRRGPRTALGLLRIASRKWINAPQDFRR